VLQQYEHEHTGTVNLSAADRQRWAVVSPMRPPRHR
jgi:hypothetical protein